jgi:hypothetical protein
MPTAGHEKFKFHFNPSFLKYPRPCTQSIWYASRNFGRDFPHTKIREKVHVNVCPPMYARQCMPANVCPAMYAHQCMPVNVCPPTLSRSSPACCWYQSFRFLYVWTLYQSFIFLYVWTLISIQFKILHQRIFMSLKQFAALWHLWNRDTLIRRVHGCVDSVGEYFEHLFGIVASWTVRTEQLPNWERAVRL